MASSSHIEVSPANILIVRNYDVEIHLIESRLHQIADHSRQHFTRPFFSSDVRCRDCPPRHRSERFIGRFCRRPVNLQRSQLDSPDVSAEHVEAIRERFR